VTPSVIPNPGITLRAWRTCATPLTARPSHHRGSCRKRRYRRVSPAPCVRTRNGEYLNVASSDSRMILHTDRETLPQIDNSSPHDRNRESAGGTRWRAPAPLRGRIQPERQPVCNRYPGSVVPVMPASRIPRCRGNWEGIERCARAGCGLSRGRRRHSGA
jgi:hypothetical protein